LLASPPPTNGAPLFLTIMKVLEGESFTGPLRSAANLDKIGRTWREVQPIVQRGIADSPESCFNYEKMVAPDSIAALRAKLRAKDEPARKVAFDDLSGFSEDLAAATTHFLVAPRNRRACILAPALCRLGQASCSTTP
jgi:hypothetical protein